MQRVPSAEELKPSLEALKLRGSCDYFTPGCNNHVGTDALVRAAAQVHRDAALHHPLVCSICASSIRLTAGCPILKKPHRGSPTSSDQLCNLTRSFEQARGGSSEDKAADVRQVSHPAGLRVRHRAGVGKLSE